MSGAEVALAWLLRRPGVTSLVIGARNEAQLQTNLKAASLHLTDDDMTQLNRVSLPPLLYPYWHQVKAASDRLGPADLALLAPFLSA